MMTQSDYIKEANKELIQAGLSRRVIGSYRRDLERRYNNNFSLTASIEIIIRKCRRLRVI